MIVTLLFWARSGPSGRSDTSDSALVNKLTPSRVCACCDFCGNSTGICVIFVLSYLLFTLHVVPDAQTPGSCGLVIYQLIDVASYDDNVSQRGSAESAASAGGTASGKTTVCDLVKQRLNDQCVVMLSQDSFYRGLTEKELENVNGAQLPARPELLCPLLQHAAHSHTRHMASICRTFRPCRRSSSLLMITVDYDAVRLPCRVQLRCPRGL